MGLLLDGEEVLRSIEKEQEDEEEKEGHGEDDVLNKLNIEEACDCAVVAFGSASM